MNTTELHTTRDVAKMLKCTERHVQNLVAQGRLHKIMLGRAVRFCPERLKQDLAAMTKAALTD